MGCCKSKKEADEEVVELPNPVAETPEFKPKYSRRKEFLLVRKADSDKLALGDVWFLISNDWMNKWVEYATKRGPFPGPISNDALLQEDGTPKPDLVIKKDYRGVNASVWTTWQHSHGGGPVLARWTLDIYGESVNPSDAASDKVKENLLSALGHSKLASTVKKYNEELDTATTENVGALFQQQLAHSKHKEAEKLHEDMQESTMGNIKGLFDKQNALGDIKNTMKAGKDENTAIMASIMGSMQGSSAYRALQAATSEEERFSAAARMIQCLWRSKLRDRKAAELKAERAHQRKVAAAKLLQSVWRSKQARRMYAKKKVEREKKQEEAAALLLQTAWKRRKARMRHAKLQKEKDEKILEASALLLQSAWRRRRGPEIKKRIAAMQRCVTVEIVKAAGLRAADKRTGASDPYVLVGLLTAESRPRYSTRTPAIEKTLAPEWNQTILFPGGSFSSTVVMTVCDKDMLGRDNFLGQVSVGISSVCSARAELKAKWVVCEMNLIPCSARGLTPSNSATAESPTASRPDSDGLVTFNLGEQKIEPRDEKGKVLSLAGVSEKPKGSITFKISVSAGTTTKCGLLEKTGNTMFRSNTFEKRWFCLANGMMRYFQSPTTIEESGVVDLADVRRITCDDATQLLQLKTPRRLWKFKGPNNAKEFGDWKAVLVRAMKAIHGDRFRGIEVEESAAVPARRTSMMF